MLVLNAHIVFAQSRGRKELNLRKPANVRIEKSWKVLTDTAIITLPRNVADFDKQKVSDVFRPGDPVTINLGYNGQFTQEFIGFVSRVSADIPIQIHCEDAMWKLKQIPVHTSFPKATLQELLFTIVEDYAVDALEVDLGKVRYANTTVAKVLDDLKRTYGLYSYMSDDTLVCGKIYGDDTNIAPVTLHLEKNVHKNGNRLEYKNADDLNIKVKAVSTMPDGKKISVEVGDETGETRQLTYYNITNEADLKKLAEEDLRKFKVDGYRGTLTTFGLPVVEHGYKVQLESDLYPDRAGLYYVESVSVRFGEGYQYSRTITLGDRAQ